MSRRYAARKERIEGNFIAMPLKVIESTAYSNLSHTARSLLLEVLYQYRGDNNGRLLLSLKHLNERGWKSRDVITRAKRELMEGGFIHETVMGHRPNKASWYAITWRPLDTIKGYDAGAAASFCKDAFLLGTEIKRTPSRQELYDKWKDHGKKQPRKNASLRPSDGPVNTPIGPSHGLDDVATRPSHGPVLPTFTPLSGPSHGHHLEKPSTAGHTDCTAAPAAPTAVYGAGTIKREPSFAEAGKIRVEL